MKHLILKAFVLVLLTVTVAALSVSVSSAQGNRMCGACGLPITDSYFETGSHFYHPHCFVCAHCGNPIKGAYSVYRGNNYHNPCFEDNVALRCVVCNGIIQGEYLLDYWGNGYHKSHKGVVLQCDFCQRFIVGELIDGMRKLPDGRPLCGECAPSSVTKGHEARALMIEVARMLESFGIYVDPRPIDLRLVGLQELRRISSDNSHDTKGFTDYLVAKNLFGHVKRETIKIYLLKGMPRVHVKSTLAHELTHVWQFQHGRLEQDRALSEGSCNFVSYLVLRKTGGTAAEFVITNLLEDPDPVYGEGFRRVKAYAEKEGLSAWLRLLEKKNPDLSKL